jgi:hypothetical protein
MRIDKTVVWLAGAAVIAVVGLTQNSFDLVLVSLLAAGVGVATRIPALKEKWLSHALSGQPQIHQIEERLRLTEDELASTMRELAELKEQHEFDSQLKGRGRS